MAFQKGHQLATGRPKGSKNKRTLQVEVIAEKFNDPFKLLMMFAEGDWKGLGYDNECYIMEGPNGATKIGYTISPEMRLAAAKEACQYLYPKRKEEHEEEPFEIHTIEEKRDFLEQAQKELELLKKEIEKDESRRVQQIGQRDNIEDFGKT